jgi:predicted acetyltransferase
VRWILDGEFATEALRLILPEALDEGLPYVEIVTDHDNVASQRVILANGGVLIERFRSLPAYGGVDKLRYRITLPARANSRAHR